MVWFQCEDCGENLKKPKLPNHFRICSAYKLSCIDCGKTFDQASVQSHNQCISEAEKYGPKGQERPSNNSQNKPQKLKPNADVDINVGLSSRPPWFCSLCNTQATSQQTLLGHADGKKHRAKARAFHASQKQSDQAVDPTPNKDNVSGSNPAVESAEVNDLKEVEYASKGDTNKVNTELPTEEENASQKKSKRKKNASDGNLDISEQNARGDLSNGEVVQAEQPEDTPGQHKKKKHGNEDSNCKEDSFHKIKWKKLVTSTLKESSDGMMKIKKLQKVVIRALQESGVMGDETELCEMLMAKINSSSRFVINNKKIQLASEN